MGDEVCANRKIIYLVAGINSEPNESRFDNSNNRMQQTKPKIQERVIRTSSALFKPTSSIEVSYVFHSPGQILRYPLHLTCTKNKPTLYPFFHERINHDQYVQTKIRLLTTHWRHEGTEARRNESTKEWNDSSILHQSIFHEDPVRGHGGRWVRFAFFFWQKAIARIACSYSNSNYNVISIRAHDSKFKIDIEILREIPVKEKRKRKKLRLCVYAFDSYSALELKLINWFIL